MSENFRAAASAAGLTPEQKAQINGLFKAVDTHRTLLGLPSNIAAQKFAQLTPEQQESLKRTFGEDEKVDENRGWLKSAAHYVKSYNPITLAFKGITEASDFMTRVYRTGSIANDQDVDWSKAWDIANDKGDKVFRPKAIAEAKAKYGDARVEVAMKKASGMKWGQIFAEADDAQKAVISEYQNNPKDGLFQDALEAVDQAKYSPGRDLASALGLRGTGAYKWVSGLGDATYRIVADPTLIAGKAKKLYDVYAYSLDAMVGSQKVAQMFAKPQVRAFWDQYGTLLGDLDKAQKAGNLEAAAAARTQLQRLAPELGETVIKEFNSPNVMIRTAQDAENYFANGGDMMAIMSGQAARTIPLMPRLDLARKTRLAMYTTADKVFNINKVGPNFLKTLYVGDEGNQTGDIVTGLVTKPTDTAENIKNAMATKRFTVSDIWNRIDRFAAKFEKIPHTKDGMLDVTDPNAMKTVYQIARLSLPRYQSKIIAEAFDASEVGKKKEILNGLWETVATVRGVNKTEAGQKLLAEVKGSVMKTYAGTVRVVDEETGKVLREYTPGVVDDTPMAVGEWQLSDAVAMPSIRDLDVMAARDGILGWVVGQSHKKWVEKATDYWSFLTLAGPRFALRNATEDLMLHLAVGNSPWGVVKGRLISTQLRLVRDDAPLGVVNKFLIKRGQKEEYAAKLNAIRVDDLLSDDEKITKIRTVMAEAVTESKIGRILSDKEKSWITDHIMLGGLDNALADVAEGGKNAVRGTDSVLRATEVQKRSGAVAALIHDNEMYVRRRGRSGFGKFDPYASQANQVSWLNLINIWSKDSLGKIAMENIDGIAGNQKAIDAVADYLRNNPKLWAKFRAEAKTTTIEDHAKSVVDTVAGLFAKEDGRLNRELFGKTVRDGKIYANDLTLSDLPKSAADTPRSISGPVFVPIAEADNITSTLIEKGYDWMGEMNARYSREPIVLDAILRIRSRMDRTGFEKEFMRRMTAQGASEEFAKKQLADLVEKKAVAYTLSYVDNPAVRTQMAFASRNFARFYRATEDFYRRIVRTVRYNPDAIAKAALTYEGIGHSGWVQQDANGESYFLYPGMAPVYKAMQATLALFGVEPAFKAPLPVQFGGKLNMVTPSLNPESLVPTFAGPLAGFSVNVVANIVGYYDPEAKTKIQTTFLGPYAANQTMLQAVLPAHINRAYAAMSKDERDGQYASAFRKAATYLAAAGKAPKPTIDPTTGEEIPPTAAQMEAYQDQLKSMTAAILATRFAFGFFAPASPQIDYKSDMADWIRDSGVSSWKQAWNSLLEAKKGDVDAAMADWAKYFPNQMPYTVGENERTVATYIRASKQAGAFVDQNKGLLEKYPQGAAFLMPLTGEFTYESYKMLRDNGLYAPKAVGDFLKEVQSAGDYATYQQQKDSYEAALAATPLDYEKRQLREQWSQWSTAFKGARPYLQERLSNFATVRPEKINALNDLQAMLADKSVRVQPKTRAALKQMVDLYNQYVDLKDSPFADSKIGDMTKAGILDQMQQIAGANPNAGAAYASIFSFLMGVKE